MNIAHVGPLFLITLALGAVESVRYLLGGIGAALPSLLPSLVLVVARRGPPGRYKVCALLFGLVEGLSLRGGWLLFPAAAVILGGAARSTRRLLPAALVLSRVLVGILGQAAFHGTLVLLQGARFPNAPVGTIVPSGPWVISLSVLAGGILFAILDRSLDRWPEARHMIERP